jgi:hypothetical protein
MTFAFTRTRQQLAEMILRKLGSLAIGQSPDAYHSVIVYEAIDLRLKEIHRLGIFWRNVTKTALSFTVSAGVTQASASADVLFPITMRAVNLSADDPIDIIGVRQYAEIENKGYTGVPTKAMHTGSSGFVFWPVPLSNTTIKLTYEKIADDTEFNAQPDVDVSMLRWLRDIIAYDLLDDFGIPETTASRWKQESMFAELQIRKLNAEHVDNETVKFCNY